MIIVSCKPLQALLNAEFGFLGSYASQVLYVQAFSRSECVLGDSANLAHLAILCKVSTPKPSYFSFALGEELLVS